ncbi:MAG: dockerin type I repeat-containing protein [Ruminococcus sp.]|nr:dockerin type I repeat-containing protein [Ruminococcus sp.]
MKKLKKLLATMSAGVMCAVSVVSFNASALTQPLYSNGTIEQVIDSFGDDAVVFKLYEEEDNQVFFEKYGKEDAEKHFRHNGKEAYIITPEEQFLFHGYDSSVTITVKDGTTLLEDELKEKISPYTHGDSMDSFFHYIGETKYYLHSTEEEVYDIIKSYEQVQSIDKNIYVVKSRLFGVDGIEIKTELADEEIINMFPELFLKRKTEEYGLGEGCKYFEIGYYKAETADGYIYNDVDLYNGLKKLQESDLPYSLSITEAGLAGEQYQSGTVNIYTAKTLDGDANEDGEVNIADATAIMQHIGNSDKYGLTMQGRANADCYNTGDGVTGMDAIAIQKLEAGLIKSLDEA